MAPDEATAVAIAKKVGHVKQKAKHIQDMTDANKTEPSYLALEAEGYQGILAWQLGGMMMLADVLQELTGGPKWQPPTPNKWVKANG